MQRQNGTANTSIIIDGCNDFEHMNKKQTPVKDSVSLHTYLKIYKYGKETHYSS